MCNKVLMEKNKVTKKIMAAALSVALAGSLCGCGMQDVARAEDTVVEMAQADADNQANLLTGIISTQIGGTTEGVDKEESVYVVADANGATQTVIVSDWLKNKTGSATLTDASDLNDITNVKGDEVYNMAGNKMTWSADGNDIYYQGTTDKELPVDVKVTYFLDGKEMSADEIAGKSGKVTIRFDYTNNEVVETEIGGESAEVYVPFTVMSAMMLPTDKFSEVTVTNGKVMSEGNADIVMGLAFPGLTESLDLDTDKLAENDIEIPNYVEVNAYTNCFELDMTMSVILSDALSDIHLTDSIDLSELDESMDKLTDASSQLMDGTGKLADGVQELSDKTGEFSDGAKKLSDGVNEYTDGASKLADGIGTAKDGSSKLSDGANKLAAGTSELKSGADSLADGAKKLDAGAGELKNGADALKTGAAGLKTGAEQLETGAAALSSGAAQIDTGAQQLAGGLAQLNGAVSGLSISAPSVSASDFEGAISAALADYIDDADTRAAVASAIASSVAGGVNSTISEQMAGTESQINTLKTSVSTLSEGATQLASNTGALKTGAEQVAGGATQLKAGADQLSGGLDAAVAGANQLSGGLSELSAGATKLAAGAGELNSGAGELASGAAQLDSGMSELQNGAGTLVSNNGKLTDGAKELYDGTGKLTDGVNKLLTGANDLNDGMIKFDKEGISKLTEAYDGDAKLVVDRLDATMDAAKNYHTFTSLADGQEGSVKFIVRTQAVK